MVYLKGIYIALTALVLIVLLDATAAAGYSKIAYKKTIGGKTSPVYTKEKLSKKSEEKPLASTNAVPPENTTGKSATVTKAPTIDSLEQPQVDENGSDMEPSMDDVSGMTDEEAEDELSADYSTAEPVIDEDETALENTGTVTTTATSSNKTAAVAATATSAAARNNNLPVPCTCGVFLNSQFKIGSNMQPHGKPVISNEQDRIYPCNAIGQKQCQTKCLEQMVQHLPNSANIICATLDRDCRKERAYLFIKNCRNHWVNTNLAAGREYCCRSGKSYQCPLI